MLIIVYIVMKFAYVNVQPYALERCQGFRNFCHLR